MITLFANSITLDIIKLTKSEASKVSIRFLGSEEVIEFDREDTQSIAEVVFDYLLRHRIYPEALNLTWTYDGLEGGPCHVIMANIAFRQVRALNDADPRELSLNLVRDEVEHKVDGRKIALPKRSGNVLVSVRSDRLTNVRGLEKIWTP